MGLVAEVCIDTLKRADHVIEKAQRLCPTRSRLELTTT